MMVPAELFVPRARQPCEACRKHWMSSHGCAMNAGRSCCSGPERQSWMCVDATCVSASQDQALMAVAGVETRVPAYLARN